ncbi:MAG: FAD-binding oxidoreductase [Thermoplasmata archaeon]|nr:FAD-binding oxidoreductase [Candidatus Sysuiplasma acidicola]MBX8645163.1 FAD-binding oxidoreductase [Candidatus Sysuiplasma acidicola]
MIVGAGVTGLSTAMNLKELDASLNICVVERSAGIAMGNTSKSASGFRTSFTSGINRMLAKATADYLLKIASSGTDIGLRQVGYLFLLPEDRVEHFFSVSRELEKHNHAIERFDPPELAGRLPGLVLRPVTEDAALMGLRAIGGALYDREAGILDPVKLCEHYYAECLKRGVVFQFNTPVTGFIAEADRPLGIPGEPFAWQNALVKGVSTARGNIRGKVVVAAGTWAPALINQLGIDARARPKTRQIFVMRGKEISPLYRTGGFSSEGILPFTFLPGGVYLRPEAGEEAFDIGFSDEFGRQYGFEEEPKPEESFFELNIRPPLKEYFPQFSGIRPSGSWAGQYIINSFDGSPIVFDEYGMIVVTGMSGSGILKSYATGRVAASLCMGLEKADLGNGTSVRTAALGYINRKADTEEMVF